MMLILLSLEANASLTTYFGLLILERNGSPLSEWDIKPRARQDYQTHLLKAGTGSQNR